MARVLHSRFAAGRVPDCCEEARELLVVAREALRRVRMAALRLRHRGFRSPGVPM